MGSQIKTLLFLEDESSFSDMIKTVRKNVDGCFCGTAQLVVVTTLEMGKRILATHDVALVILDLTLVDSRQEDSIDFIRHNHEHWPPIYVLTGDERIEVRRECLFAGAAGFAIKRHVLESPNFFFASLLNMYLKANRPLHGAK